MTDDPKVPAPRTKAEIIAVARRIVETGVAEVIDVTPEAVAILNEMNREHDRAMETIAADIAAMGIDVDTDSPAKLIYAAGLLMADAAGELTTAFDDPPEARDSINIARVLTDKARLRLIAEGMAPGEPNTPA